MAGFEDNDVATKYLVCSIDGTISVVLPHAVNLYIVCIVLSKIPIYFFVLFCQMH
jgi:hypothetical protein